MFSKRDGFASVGNIALLLLSKKSKKSRKTDDRARRQAAQRLGFPKTGSIGVWLRLKEQGFIESAMASPVPYGNIALHQF
ncbi:MAG: hypothetical protein GVY04_15460 [Cyanobacteria bacterium]|jgi:predicted nucleic acid-binding protein|nr:hypothetical protein [Cyanobacteria bacterium GSL.Bin1]